VPILAITCHTGGVDLFLHYFFTLPPDGGERLSPRPGRFIQGVRGWVGPRAALEISENK